MFTESHMDLGITIDRTMKFHNHISRNVSVAGGLTTNLLSSTICRTPKFMIGVYTSQVRPKLEYASCVWHTGYLGDLQMLEHVQRRWTRAVSGMESLSYGERLKLLGLYSFQDRLIRSDLLMVWKILNGLCAINFNQMFNFAPAAGTRGHCYKLALAHNSLDARKRFFSQRVIPRWNSLSQATVTASTLSEFKRLLELDLGGVLYEYS